MSKITTDMMRQMVNNLEVCNPSALKPELVNMLRELITDREYVEIPTIDLCQIEWEMIQKAASESSWMPPEYCANDWIHDVCDFLRNGPNNNDV